MQYIAVKQNIFKMCCGNNCLGHTDDVVCGVLWATPPFKWNANCKQNHISKLQAELSSSLVHTFGHLDNIWSNFKAWNTFLCFGLWAKVCVSPPIGASTPKKHLQSKLVQMFSGEMFFIRLLLNFWIKYILIYTCDILPLWTCCNCSPNAHTLLLVAPSIWSSWGTVRSSVTICFDATNSSALA